LANTQSVAKMLEDGYLADLPIVVAAIDPCFSCTDRTIVVRGHGDSKTMGWEELVQYGIRWYREQGVDPASIRVRGDAFA
jgi:membrane-bound hydrogenase subunit alpha